MTSDHSPLVQAMEGATRVILRHPGDPEEVAREFGLNVEEMLGVLHAMALDCAYDPLSVLGGLLMGIIYERAVRDAVDNVTAAPPDR